MLVELIESGLALVGVPLGEKGPTKPSWNLRHNAITSPNDVRQLQGKNVGLAHAYCSPSPTCAIDVDDYPVARRWLTNNGFDLKRALQRPESVLLASGKRNSIKLLYRLPHASGPYTTKQIMSGENRVILEFRCASRLGHTVQDLIPPSIHPSGSSYRWLGSGCPQRLPTISDDLLAIWQELIQRDEEAQSSRSSELRSASPREIALIKDALTHINADCGYIVWRNVVWALLSTGYTGAYLLASSWSQTAPTCFDQSKFQRLVNSYNPNIHGGHTIGTIYHYARAGGWSG